MQISAQVYRFEDSCHVYVLTTGRQAVLIDFGTGDVLDHLAEFGVDQVTDVLMTHHHRDQAQGLPRAVAAGIRIWVPRTEQDLFDSVDEHWQERAIRTDYNLRQDRFSLIAPVPVHAAVPEYRRLELNGHSILTLPTPGHTTGSVSYFVDIDGLRMAFTGDLIYGPGQVWSLAATQWTYTGHGGIAATVLSLHDVAEERPDLLLPSHGTPIDDVRAAIATTEPPLRALLEQGRPEPWDLDAWRNRPFEEISPHLLRNRTANAQSYAVLSDSGTALLIDFGYDMVTDWATGDDRAARRAWLPSLRALKRDFGIEKVEVAIPTHYHDDHVAGFNLLRDVEGTEIWSESEIARILAEPHRFDLPCLYRDPIAVDRLVPTGVPVPWREYELTLYPQPGHCLNAVAIGVEVDGALALATGDQQESRWSPGIRPEVLNYQYRNGFRPQDYVDSALLYRRLRPDLLLTGHWGVRRVDDEYLDELLAQGQLLVDLHREVLGRNELDFGPGDFMATIEPYFTVSAAGAVIEYQVEIANPFKVHGSAVVSMVVPPGWSCSPTTVEMELAHGQTGLADFAVRSPNAAGRMRRVVLAADLTVNDRRLGQRAECLVDLR